MLFHQFHEVLSAGEKGFYAISPIAESCSMDEDFVGKASRISRRVGVRGIAERTLDSYLISAKLVWDALRD